MQIFKLCMKIIQKNMSSMLIYVSIFLGISIAMSFSSMDTNASTFSTTKTSVAFISEETTPLTEGFKQELAKNVNFVELPDQTEKLQDALFFRTVEYIIHIPKGFSESFLRGEPVQIQKTIVPNSASAAYLDIDINQYFNTARLYVKAQKDITQEQLVAHLKEDMTSTTSVQMKQFGKVDTSNSFSVNFYNFLSYALSAVIILGTSTVMLVMNDQKLSRRNACSPISAGKMNTQFILGTLVFTLSSWAIMVIFCLIMDFKSIKYGYMIYLILNSLVFTLCASGMSFLIGNLLHNRTAISAVCNVVTLGPCFISGVFVPQTFLSESVLKIASFTPTYWFVKANNQVSSLMNFNLTTLSPIFSYMLIELGFAAAFFAVALAIGKRRKTMA